MPKHACTMHPAVTDRVASRTLLKMSHFLKVMADPTRLKLVNALMLSEMCVCDLAALLGMEHSAVSHQLAVLRKIDVVSVRKEGKMKYYSLSDDHINTVFSITLMQKMERAVGKIEGVNSVDFCFLTQRFTLDAEDDRFDDILSCAVKKCRKIDPDCKIVL